MCGHLIVSGIHFSSSQEKIFIVIKICMYSKNFWSMLLWRLEECNCFYWARLSSGISQTKHAIGEPLSTWNRVLVHRWQDLICLVELPFLVNYTTHDAPSQSLRKLGKKITGPWAHSLFTVIKLSKSLLFILGYAKIQILIKPSVNTDIVNLSMDPQTNLSSLIVF